MTATPSGAQPRGVESVGEPHRWTLADGRTIAYGDHGPDAGRPVVYCHGAPGSKRNWLLHHDAGLLERLHLRVLAPDRPGIGHSSDEAGRTLTGWPRDVAELADHLGLDRFTVLAFSAGAPYAFACAAAMPERIERTVIVSGSGDPTDPALPTLREQDNIRVLALGRDRPWASRGVFRLMAAMARFAPRSFVRQAAVSLPPVDQRLLADPAVAHIFVSMVRDTLRQGPRGAQRDAAIVSGPWGVDLTTLPGPVRLWHGALDRNVPIGVAEHHARILPHAQLTTLPDEGHLSLAHRHMAEILGELSAPAG